MERPLLASPENPEGQAIYDMLRERYPELHPMLRAVGVLDLKALMKKPYPALVGAIIGQKISYKVARDLRGAIYKAVGGTDFTPAKLQAAEKKLSSTGLTKIPVWQTIRRLNQFLHNKPDDYLDSEDNIRALAGNDSTKSVIGIGPWTVETTLLVCFAARPGGIDIFPTGDKFLQKALARLPGSPSKVTEAEAKKISDKWAPHRGYVTWYLWRWFP